MSCGRKRHQNDEQNTGAADGRAGGAFYVCLAKLLLSQRVEGPREGGREDDITFTCNFEVEEVELETLSA